MNESDLMLIYRILRRLMQAKGVPNDEGIFKDIDDRLREMNFEKMEKENARL